MKQNYRGEAIKKMLQTIAEQLETGADPKEIAQSIREWLEKNRGA